MNRKEVTTMKDVKNSKTVDVAIIGAGTAGMSAYRAVREHTDSVVVIESGVYGTTCARVGCMPSKLLIAAAEVSHQIDQAQQFGIDVSGKQIAGERVMARVKSERDRFVGFVEQAVEEWPAEHKLTGHAVFQSANELLVGDHTLVRAGRSSVIVCSLMMIFSPGIVCRKVSP